MNGNAVQPRATMKDVAQRANVSKATVSRVVNGLDLVTPETRERVEAAMRDAGYVVSYQARSLATGRTGAVALLVTEPLEELWRDPTFASLLQGIYSALSPTDLTPLLLQASSPSEQMKTGSQIEQGVADGVIHLTPYIGAELLQLLAQQPRPVVLCGRLPGDPFAGRHSTVYADDVIGAQKCAHYLASRGRSRPAAILGPPDNPASIDRLEGYRTVYGTALSDAQVRHCGWDEYSGALATEDLLRSGAQFDALLCASDRIAVGAIRVLQQHGVAVPASVAVVGFDDHPLAAEVRPALTTVAQPLQSEGMVAAELLREQLEGGEPRDVVLPMELRIRESA